MRETISEAVILMAGSGSRLRDHGENRFKPTLSLLGRSLISYIVDALTNAGIKKVSAVLGFEANALRNALQPIIPPQIEIAWVYNSEWQKQNGLSVLAAKPHVSGRFILTMGDHLFDPSIVDLLVRETQPRELTVAIDRKLKLIFDLNDAMKLQLESDRVVAIGKQLQTYNAIDTGLFVCPAQFFDYLETAKYASERKDCSLADGVRLMAEAGAVRGIDIGERWWQDVDTPEMLAHAEKQLRTRRDQLASARPDRGDRAQN